MLKDEVTVPTKNAVNSVGMPSIVGRQMNLIDKHVAGIGARPHCCRMVLSCQSHRRQVMNHDNI